MPENNQTTEQNEENTNPKRFQVNFSDPSHAKALDSFIATLQEVYNVPKKYGAVSLMLNLAQKQFAKENVGTYKISFVDKHYALLETQTNNLLREFKAALTNADNGLAVIQKDADERIEEIKKEKDEVIKSLGNKISKLQGTITELEESNDSLKKENKELKKLQKAFEKNESAWNTEKQSLLDKIELIQRTNKEKESLSDVVSTLSKTVTELQKGKGKR